MRAKVVGVQIVDYVSKKSNKPVKGVTLHCNFKDSQVEGEAAEGVFISDNLGLPVIYDIKPGAVVDISYNSRGYVCDLAVCK